MKPSLVLIFTRMALIIPTLMGMASFGFATEPDLNLEPQPASHSETGAVAQAESLVAKKDFDGAIKILKAQGDKLNRKGLITLSRAYAGKKDFTAELRTLDLGVKKSPNDYILMTAYADALARAKKNDEAIAMYQSSKEINPRYKPTYDGLFSALEVTGDTYEARIQMEDMVKRFGPTPLYSASLCRLYTRDSFLDKAVQACETAIARDGKNPLNYVNLAVTQKQLEKEDKAIRTLTIAAKKFPKSEEVQASLAQMHADKNNFVEANNYYRKAVEANPESSTSLAGYAASSFKLQKYDEALKMFIKACKLDRNMVREFRVAIGLLKNAGEADWRLKYEGALDQCK